MDDAELMRLLERIDERQQDGQGVFLRKLPALQEHITEGGALEELHHQIHRFPVVLAHVEHFHDVGMVELNRRARLSQEPLAEQLEMRQRRIQQLHRHLPLRPEVGCSIHSRDPT